MDSDFAGKANTIFLETALTKDDVLPETVSKLMAHELNEAVNLFSGLIDSEQVKTDLIAPMQRKIAAAEFFRNAVVEAPYEQLEFEGEKLPVHQIASLLAEDIAEVLSNLDLDEPWRGLYDHIVSRLSFYATVLRTSPHHKIRFI